MECSCVVVVVVLCDVVYVIEHSIFYLLQDCFYIHIVVSKICSKVNQNSEDSLSFIWAVILLNIYIYCETSILAPSARKHEWKMQPVAAQRALYRRQNAYTMGPKLGPQIWKLGVYCGPIFGSRICPLFWGHKTQTGAIQYGQQVCYCRRKLTAAHIRDTPRVHAREAFFTTYLRLRF